jgi:MEMO1 family protein
MPEAGCDRFLRQMLKAHGPALLHLAAGSISHGLARGKPIGVDKAEFAAELAADGACFVTLKHAGRLRGCVGSTQAHRPLIDDVAANAFAAAFADRRFPGLKPAERRGLDLSVTVLGSPQPIAFVSEAALCAELRPHVDGLIIECDGHSAVFLPQVWDILPSPRSFLNELKAKTGVARSEWSSDFRAWRFVAECVSSSALDHPETLWL